MENYIKDFIVKYNELTEQIQRNLLLAKKQSSVDSKLLSGIREDLLLLGKACGLVGYQKLANLARVLADIIVKIENRGVKYDSEVGGTLSRAAEVLHKTLQQTEGDEEQDIPLYQEIIDELEAIIRLASQPAEDETPEPEQQMDGGSETDAGQLQEYIDDFLLEGYDNIDAAENILLELEKTPDDRRLIDNIFRLFHTIKGSCGIVGLGKTESIVHRSENLIGCLKNGKLAFSAEISDTLFQIIDVIRSLFAEIEATHQEGDKDYQALLDRLEQLQQAGTVPAPESSQPKKAASLEPEKTQAKKVETGKPEPETKAEKPQAATKPAVEEKPSEPDVKAVPVEAKAEESQVAGSLPTPETQASDAVAADGTSVHEEDSAIQRFKSSTSVVTDKTIRIDIDLLDKMMDQIGELVLTRNQIIQVSAAENIASLNSSAQGLNLITSELQNMIMQTRMQPIKHIWDKFPRMVRDLANSSGKKVQVIMEGADTELDRSMLEEIRDPLMHLVRNSIDHGIESPEERIAQGKPPEGLLVLKAYNEAGKVDIEISDDGRGINPENIKQKALEKGLINREQADKLSEREALELIFMSGLSTAKKITNVSGRGVGMDVVKTNIEKIGGIIATDSRIAQGTSFSIKIPLTLVIIPVLLVTCGEDQYAIAQSNIVELVNLDGKEIVQEIELIHDVPVYRLRGNLLPLIFLDKLLKIATCSYKEKESLSIVIIRIGTRQYGLVVDEIVDSQEIVIKPLSRQLKNLACYSGATIIGDGKVALVLDVLGIIKIANLMGDDSMKEMGHHNIDALLESNESERDKKRGAGNLQTLLLFEDMEYNRMAMPFSKAARLEEFRADAIEHVGGQDVVQYRGDIMPLIYIPSHVQHLNGDSERRQIVHVIVYAQGEHTIGLVVKDILDIMETELTIKGFSQREGVMFTTVIQQHVVEVLDIDKIIGIALPHGLEKWNKAMQASVV